MRLTPRGRGVVAGLIGAAVLLVLVWAALKDAGQLARYESHCQQTRSCGAPQAP